MQPIIDLHAHIFPQNVFDKIWGYFDKHHWPIAYRTSEPERAQVLESRTDRYTTLCYAHRPGMAAWLNDYVLAYAQEHPKAIATGTFHPDDADVATYVADGLKRGLKGFKLHLEVQKFDPADPRLEKVYAILEEAGTPAHVHTSGTPLEGPWTGPAHFERMLKLTKRLPIIVAHLGGSQHLDYFKYTSEHPLSFDTAMVGVDYPGFGALASAQIDHIRAHIDHYVFGTDFPSIPYAWEHQVAAVQSWNLGAANEEKIFAGNARRLYGL